MASHQKFTEKYNLPSILISDSDLQVIKALRHVAGKETLWKGKYGLGALHIYHR